MAADIEHLQVSANGITFHVAASGPADAPPVLCLHGFPEGSMSWRPVMERLGEARVYAPDLRGYPGSGRPEHAQLDVNPLRDLELFRRGSAPITQIAQDRGEGGPGEH